MHFNVVVSELAEQQYDQILSYLAYSLKNPQAVYNLMDDYDTTINRLELTADKFGLCNSKHLKKMGLHKIRFEKHRYLFLYRIINDNQIIIEGMYHELQDYEHAI